MMLIRIPTPAVAAPDDWPRFGHDAALTGRSALKGDISEPRVAWSYSVAGREMTVELIPKPGEHSVTLSDETPLGEAAVATPGPRMLDIDGAGLERAAQESLHERWAKILPEVKGYQRVAWNQTWTTEKVCRLQLFAYDEGWDRPRMVWETDPPEDTIFSPLDIVRDIDGDGVAEVCVAAHYRVMIFEGTTGRKETELRYHGSRPYGWFGIRDLDGDGREELITIGDFQSHIDVLAYDRAKPEAERLSVVWRRDIEQNIDERVKWPAVGPRPVANVVGGEDRLEIVLNLYNDKGDGEWHVVVLDGMTGETKVDLPGRFLAGVADVNADGTDDLFVTASDGLFVPAFGRVELVTCAGGGVKTLWADEEAGWVTQNLARLGEAWSTSATDGMRHVLLAGDGNDERPAFLVRRHGTADGESVTLAAMRDAEGRGVQELWRVDGLCGEVEAVALEGSRGEGCRAAVRMRLPGSAEPVLNGNGIAARLVKREPLGIRVSSPISARLRREGPMAVVTEGAGETVFAIEPSGRAGGPPRLLWQRAGRGMADGSRHAGPLAADLDGDGGAEIVVARRGRRGEAVLAAIRDDGTAAWSRPFERTPGDTPEWNRGALTYWWAGQFRDAERVDLFVNTRRGLMHSDVGHVLDGRDGSAVWTQEKASVPGVIHWGYAGTPPAIADVTGDGLDELISLYPVCYWVADGRTGEIRTAMDLARKDKLPAWAAYGEPMVYDFDGDGQLEVLLDSVYILALLELDGTPVWHGAGRADFPVASDAGNVGETTSTKHALIDIDGDGTFELASAGYGDGARVIDPRDGKVLWSVEAVTPTCQRVAAANLDGRPGDELIYPAGDTLVVITGDRSAGRVLWTWRGPASLSMPAIADVDGDGLAEIVVQSAEGAVHCIDGAAE